MSETLSIDFKRYAEVAVGVGVNLQPKQGLFIRAPIEARKLVDSVIEVAQERGCTDVGVWWEDIKRRREILLSDATDFEEKADWDAMNKAAEAGYGLLLIKTEHPGIMRDVDPVRIQAYQEAYLPGIEGARRVSRNKMTNWSVICAPSQEWAADLYPDDNSETQLRKLTEALFYVARLGCADPMTAWEEHSKQLHERSRVLNAMAFSALHFSSAATDLTIGLVQNHLWTGGVSSTVDERGISFMANVPTEEVFTMPHREEAQGYVTATKPLAYQGNILRNFTVRFEGGEVVEVLGGNEEKEIIGVILAHDESARRLGEVGLVGYDSPIAQLGQTFGCTLLDENSATHLAWGGSYPETLQGGIELKDEEYAAQGGNKSQVHVDFMVGSNELTVQGILSDGSKTPIIYEGNWVLCE